MQAGQIILVRTNPATQFTGTLAQNAAATVSLATMLPAGTIIGDGYVDGGLGAGLTVRARLRGLTIVSMENLAWEVWLWAKDTFNTFSVLGDLMPLGRWSFAAGDGVQIAGTGPYYYYVDGNDQPYIDALRKGEINLMLVNRSITGKSAGDPGAILLQLAFEPTYGR